MPAALDWDQCDFVGRSFAEHVALIEGDQIILIAMKDVYRTFSFAEKAKCGNVILEDPAQRQESGKPPDLVCKAVIRRIEDQHTGLIVRCKLCRDTASKGSSIEDDLVFAILRLEPIIDLPGVGI